jgi:hypothetical protein
MSSSAILLLTVSVAIGQASDTSPAYENLKSYEALIGTWVYEGPLLEDVPGMAKKGSRYYYEGSFEWILDKGAIEEYWQAKFAGGVTVSAKALTGWGDKKVVSAGVFSGGGYFHADVTLNQEGKTWRYESKAVDGEGKKSSETFILELVDDNTLIVHSKDREGTEMPPESPKYTFKKR